jgi:hypothetical protein
VDLSALLAESAQNTPDIDALCGRWHIVKTSLAIWRRRSAPTITYARLPGAGVRLSDEIRYLGRRGRSGQLLGVDTQDAAEPRIFHWRGAGWATRWLSSSWCFVDHDPDWRSWAATYFSATPFTAAGLDIYGRTPDLDADMLAEIEARLSRIAPLAPLIATLFRPGQKNDS